MFRFLKQNDHQNGHLKRKTIVLRKNYTQSYSSCFLFQVAPAVGVVHAQFDAGARFNKTSPPSLPPPPPGVPPTPAQVHKGIGKKKLGTVGGTSCIEQPL